jgi:AcrR family transcriptional regulator
MAAKTETRWRRRKDARPAEILHAALACFKERGFAATRLEEVAARAKVTKGTIYLYYDSKEELFKAAVTGELLPNIERLEAAFNLPGPVIPKLELLFAFFARDVLPSPISVMPKLVLSEAGNFPELARFYLDAVVHRMFRLLAGVLQRGIDNGELRAIDVNNAVYCIIGPLLLTALWHHSLEPYDDHRLDAEAICRAHLDLLLHGLKAAPALLPAVPAKKGGRI